MTDTSDPVDPVDPAPGEPAATDPQTTAEPQAAPDAPEAGSGPATQAPTDAESVRAHDAVTQFAEFVSRLAVMSEAEVNAFFNAMTPTERLRLAEAVRYTALLATKLSWILALKEALDGGGGAPQQPIVILRPPGNTLH